MEDSNAQSPNEAENSWITSTIVKRYFSSKALAFNQNKIDEDTFLSIMLFNLKKSKSGSFKIE